MGKKVFAVGRVLFGLFFFLNGINFYLQIYEFPPVENETANLLMAGFVTSGMFEFVKVAEVATGLSLMLNRFVPLFLVVSFPLTVIIAYIDVFLLGTELGAVYNGGGMFLVHCLFLAFYLPYYRTMFASRGEPDLGLTTLRGSGEARDARA